MKHFNPIWLIIAISIICYFIPREYFTALTVQNHETNVVNTLSQSFTYMFLSEHWYHLFSNMTLLIVLRKEIYFYTPPIFIVVFFVIWVFLCGLIYFIISYHIKDYNYLIGGSGAIYGFLGYLINFMPNQKYKILWAWELRYETISQIIIVALVIQGTMIFNKDLGPLIHIIGMFLGFITGAIYKYILCR